MLSGLGRYQVTASRGRVNKPSFQTKANFGGAMNGPGGGVPMGTSSRTFGKNTQGDLLQMLMGGTDVEVRFMCRDMYMHDPVAGSVVDLVSHIPFGPYTLSGIPDKDALRIFQSCCEKLRIDSLFKALSVDYHVTGAFLGILNFDQARRIFDAVLPQNLDNCLTGDTKVLTDQGWKTMWEIAEPLEEGKYPINYVVNGVVHPGTAPFFKGRQPVFEVKLDNGKTLKGTAEHRVQVWRKDRVEIDGARQTIHSKEWVEIGNLEVGDRLVVNNAQNEPVEKTREFYEHMFLGSIMGDGWIADGRPRLTLHKEDKHEIEKFLARAGVIADEDYFSTVGCAYDRKERTKNTKQKRMSFNNRAFELVKRAKLTAKKGPIRIDNRTQLMGYLSGLIVTDGWIQGGADSSVCIKIAGKKRYLEQVFDELLRYGYSNCHLKRTARKGDKTNLSEYKHDLWVLTINSVDARELYPDLKLTRLKRAPFKEDKKRTKKEGFRQLAKLPAARVESVEYIGRWQVYDIFVPEVNYFVANGVVVHNCEITPVPVFGHTPLIDLRPSREIEALMKFQGDPRAERFLRALPEVLKNAGKTGKIQLNPENTLYVPRTTFASQFHGVSVFRRMLPLYLLEKALMRGTIELAHRRQRGILHLMMGDDMWLPTNEELKEGADMFQVADSDPVGAIIATRPGMQVQEVQQGGEFWRWTDVMEALNAQKFRAMGISEGFLNGEANVEGVESGMSVFVQQTRALRDYITRTALYEKVFPYLAVTNEVRKGEDRVYGRGDMPGMICGSAEEGYRVLCDGQTSILEDHNLDISDYHIPVVTWHNQLRPEGNAAYMEMLTRLQQLGLPIPMRMLAAAGGISLQDVLYGVDEDLEVRKEVSKYAEKVMALNPDAMQPQEQASLRESLEKIIRAERGKPQRGLGARDFGDMQERESPNEINGHRYVSTAAGRRARQEKADRIATEAAQRLHERMRHEGDKPSMSTAKFSPF